jgi:hypothetical protein
MAIDLFATRYMLNAVTQFKRPKRYFLDTYFPGIKIFDTETVDVDVIKNKRVMAPFQSPLTEGKVMDKTGFSSHALKPAYVKPKDVTTAQQLLTRTPGSVVYPGTQTMADRAAIRLAQDFMLLQDSIVRREEWMAAQALITGQVPVIGEGINILVDFLMADNHKVTLLDTARWSNKAKDADGKYFSNPLDDLVAWGLQVLQDSGLSPNRVDMGCDVWREFITHPSIAGRDGIFNNLKINTGQIQPEQLEDGVAYCGSITYGTLNVDIYVYVDWYIDDQDGNTEKMLLPADRLVMGSTRAQNTKLYGAIQDIEAIEELGAALIATSVYPKTWVTKDPSQRWIQLQSAPLPALNQPDAFFSAKPI